MLKIYDKAQWHIDGGEDVELVIARFKSVFRFLADKDLLSPEGMELLEIGMDSSASLHERMVSDKGNKFLSDVYEEVEDLDYTEIEEMLEKKYIDFVK